MTTILSVYPPKNSLDLLTQLESDLIQRQANSDIYALFRNCLIAVLSTGSLTDDADLLFEKFEHFEAEIIRTERGIRLDLINPPADILVDGELTKLIQKNLFSILRDILFTKDSLENYSQACLENYSKSHLITNTIFTTLRNAGALIASKEPNVITCWGGHSISDIEFAYANRVGYELGLRGLDICTGCGPGAMEAPMRGAARGHRQQGYLYERFIGITEPSIIAAEPPNPIVNELIIMPDIEKRIESFIRLSHGLIIFPGGVGTVEELLYLLGILMLPENKEVCLPLILTGPKESRQYFEDLNRFVELTLGKDATNYYEIIIDDPQKVAQVFKAKMHDVTHYRQAKEDLYSFSWTIHIPLDFQMPFIPTHENMSNLDLHYDQEKWQLAAQLRKVFSGIVAGNIKKDGVDAIKKHGLFKIHGDKALLMKIDELLIKFIAEGRMKLPGKAYEPCYEIVYS